MGIRQTFRFSAQSETLVEDFLRSLGEIAHLDEEREVFLFANPADKPRFQFYCVIVQGGIDTDGSGEYFEFLGLFIEVLTREFGSVMVQHT